MTENVKRSSPVERLNLLENLLEVGKQSVRVLVSRLQSDAVAQRPGDFHHHTFPFIVENVRQKVGFSTRQLGTQHTALIVYTKYETHLLALSK